MGVCAQQKDKRKENNNYNVNNKDKILTKCDDKIKNCNSIIKSINIEIDGLQEEAKAKLRVGDKVEAKRLLTKKKKLIDCSKKIKEFVDKIEEERMLLSEAKLMSPLTNLIGQTNKQLNEDINQIKNDDFLDIKEGLNEIKDIITIDNLNENEIIKRINTLLEDLDKFMKNHQKNISSIEFFSKSKQDISFEENTIEKKKNEEEKNRIFEKQKEFRIQEESNVYKKEETKVILEDMCIIGTIMKKEIIEEKKNNPDKFIPTEKALQETNNKQIFCLGILAKSLENCGIVTAIEKNPSSDVQSQDASNTVLQFITNGLINKNKYNFHFDFGEERNNELLNNKIEQKMFNDKLRKKLSIEYNIPEDKIILTNPQKGSYEIQVIFETDEFNKIDILNMDKFKEKCKNDANFKELCHLKQIHKSLIMEGCKLSENMLDSAGNRESGWEVGGTRGGYPYTPPEGWKGFGLKVKGKYDNGNDDWIACNGNPNEWAVAYHGIGTKLGMRIEDATHNIIKGGFKAGGGQAYKDDDDANHPGQKVGVGVYCSPDPNVMESYAKSTVNSGRNYQMGFMMRVKPNRIRYSNNMKNFWVLDGTTQEMRPYRILIKEC